MDTLVIVLAASLLHVIGFAITLEFVLQEYINLRRQGYKDQRLTLKELLWGFLLWPLFLIFWLSFKRK